MTNLRRLCLWGTAACSVSVLILGCALDTDSEDSSGPGSEAAGAADPASGTGGGSSGGSTSVYDAGVAQSGTGGASTAGTGGASYYGGSGGTYTATGGTSTGGTATGGTGTYYPAGEAAGAGAVTQPGTGGAATGGASNEDDRYTPVGTNPFTLVGYDPLSTFAADVDTASYDIFRRDINLGILPQPESVRLEEFVNYFEYAYPKAAYDSSVPFSISLAAAPNILDRETQLLRVGIQGKAAPPFERKPANLVFLVDVSGSMSADNKLPLVQQLLRLALDELLPTDTISIVTYASGTGVRLEPTPVSNRATIEAVINSLSAGGSTAGAAGLDLAYQQAESNYLDNGINHVLLCTDGDFNVGPSTNDALIQLIEEKRATGVTLTVLGFGVGNLNDSMMEAVSNAGNGVYGVISDADQAARYVEERLLSTMNFIAKDMKIQVEFNPNFIHAYRLLGYENRAIGDQQFRDDSIDGGEVGADHRVTAIYELVPVGSEIPLPEGAPEPKDGEPYAGEVEVAPSDLVLVKVRYKDLDAVETDPALEVNLSLMPEEVAASHTDLDTDFQWAVAVAAFAEILKQSPYGDAAFLPQVEQIVTANANDDADRTEFVSLFGTAQTLLSP
jgi:Ca-activated chloride channel family protein